MVLFLFKKKKTQYYGWNWWVDLKTSIFLIKERKFFTFFRKIRSNLIKKEMSRK